MSSNNTSVKNRPPSASGNDSIADLKIQVQEIENKLNDLSVKVDAIIVEQASMKDDIRAILESVKLLEKSVSNLTLEMKELRGEKSSKVITSSKVSEEQYFDGEEFNVPSYESLNSSRQVDKQDPKAVKQKKLRRLSDNLFNSQGANFLDDDIKEELVVVEKERDDVNPTDLLKYMEERNVTLKKLKPDDVLKFLEAIDDYMLQGKKTIANVEKQFHMIISKDLLSQLYAFNYSTSIQDGGLEIGIFFSKVISKNLTQRNHQHLQQGIIFNNRTTLQQLQWKALRGLIVAYVTPKDMSSFCTTLYQVMNVRYVTHKKSVLARLPPITPETQIKQWPVFYEFLTTLAKVYSELFLWVQGSMNWGATPFDVEWTGATKANVKTTIKAILDAHSNVYLRGLYAQVELMSAGNQGALVPQRGENVPFDYVMPKAKKQTAILSASQFIEAMTDLGRSDTEAAKAWKSAQTKSSQLNFKDYDSDDGEKIVNELMGDFYDGYKSDTERSEVSDEASFAELWTKAKHKIKGKNWDDVCWCLIFGDTCKGNCKPKSNDPDLDRAKASVFLLWQANQRLEYAHQHKKKIEEFQAKIKPVLVKRGQKIDWVWHDDEAKGSPTKPQREPPTVPYARKKQFNSLETQGEEKEKDDFSAIAKGGDY